MHQAPGRLRVRGVPVTGSRSRVRSPLGIDRATEAGSGTPVQRTPTELVLPPLFLFNEAALSASDTEFS